MDLHDGDETITLLFAVNFLPATIAFQVFHPSLRMTCLGSNIFIGGTSLPVQVQLTELRALGRM